MEYRTLGRTGLEVSRVSLGTGGPSRLGQRTHGDEQQSHRVVQRALDLGINLIDTAANYSDSEEILGRALKSIPRDRYILGTKFEPAPEIGGPVNSPDDVIKSCERSLQRLGLETIDIFQFHGALPENYEEAVEKLYPAVEQLRAAGKIRFIGITEYFYKDPDHQMLERALADDLWDTLMVKYGLLNQTAERAVLPLAREKNVGVMSMSPVRVRLTRPETLRQLLNDWINRGLLPADALPQDDPLGFLVEGEVTSLVDAGYRFGAEPEEIDTVIVGTGNVDHLEANIRSIHAAPLPEEHSARLRELFGHLAESEQE